MTPHPQTDGRLRELTPLWARVVKYGIIIVTAIFYLTVVLQYEYTPDASYISFRVAWNVARGEGFHFNPGEPSGGSSGPVWSLILAAGEWGGLEAPVVAKTFDLVFACLALFAVYFLGYLVLRDKVAAFFAALLFSVDAWLLRSSASGLGFSFALLLLVVVLWYGFRREYGVASLVCGVLVLTAPVEGLLLWAVMMVDAMALWRRERVLPGPLLRSIALGILPIAPWMVYSISASVTPFTSGAVESFTGTPFDGPAGGEIRTTLLWYAASGGILIVLIVVGHAVALWRSDWRLLAPSSFPLVWAMLAAAVSLAQGGSGMSRTWILLNPVLVIYGLLGLYYLSLFIIGMGRRSTFALLSVVVAILLMNQLVYRVKVLPEMHATVLEMQQQVRPAASWIRARLGPDRTVVAPFGGLIGWITGSPVQTNPFLWSIKDETGSPTDTSDYHALRSLLTATRRVTVIDRSSSPERLRKLNLVPLRTWQGDGESPAYTVYGDPAWRDSLTGPPGGPAHKNQSD